MRSRFLNIDYFSLSPPQSREALSFLYLPVPRLTSPPPSNVEDHLRFDSTLNVSLRIDRLPIDAALSKFLSDVLPHSIDVNFHDFEAAISPPNQNYFSSFSTRSDENRISEQDAHAVFEENEEDNPRNSGSEVDVQFSKESEKNALSKRNESVYKMIQFETPELDALMENAFFTEKERMQMLSQTLEVDNNLEMLMPELSMYEVLESISLDGDVTSEYLMEQNSDSLPDNNSDQNSGQSKFPILEVDEESLGILACLSMEENVGSHFDNIRPQNLDEKHHSIIEGKELLGSMKYSMMDFVSVLDDCLSKMSVVLSDMLPERDFINMLEAEHVHGNSFLEGKSQADSASLANLVTFHEFLFLDEDLTQTFGMFYTTKTLDDPKICECLFKEEFNYRNFDELIVSNEIALTDDKFKPLPVPVISDYGKMTSLYVIIGEMLSNLKARPLSVTDGIYLNWDLLEQDKCNRKFYHYYQHMWAKIDLNSIDFDGKHFNDGKLVNDLIFSSDSMHGCDIEQSEELQKLLSDCNFLLDYHTTGVASSKLLDDESPGQGSGEKLAKRNAKRASLLFKSMSEVSNLDYFLNPQKATASGNCDFAVESTDANVEVSNVTSTDLKGAPRCTGLQSQGWHMVMHKVKLSDNIVALIGNLEKSYLSCLQSETELSKAHNSAVDYVKLLRIPKQKLMECNKNKDNIAFIVLCVIKHVAWYICFYGLHPACLYIDKICQSFDFLKSGLSFVQSLIKDENSKVGTKIAKAHPSLTVFEEILQSSIKQQGLKVLIVAEEVFWWSLKHLLLSMGLSYNELNNTYQPYAHYADEDTDTTVKDLMASDCLMVSYKYLSPLFPFNKFSIILEYGGSFGSSRISNFSPNSVGLPHLHFLRIELDGHPTLKALCEGVEMPPETEILMEDQTHLSFDPKESLMNQNSGKCFNVPSLEQNHGKRSSKATDEVDCFGPPVSAVKSEHNYQSIESFPETVIIVNTENVDKEMIMSRRRTYQVILAMEKEGVQVVERDLDLPVDIIISSAICLLWYDIKILGRKATPVTETSSSVPLCIENIATNVLTLLSFSFGGCFLVFEGEANFLFTVMESSDGLYAAAASLGIDLQIFFSHSSELTNEIIVGCIKCVSKLTSGMYPKMPDSVTLAESFLTHFPSINPLTAHAILSSGAMLTEFLEWPHEQRIRLLKKYHVPEESIDLFSAFCKYGEREDAKSVMTDSSSSVSSGPDSDRCHLYQVDHERKRKKDTGSAQKDELCFEEFLHFEPSGQVGDGFLDSCNLSKPSNPCMSRDAGRSGDLADASLSMSDLLGPNQGFNMTTTIGNPSRVFQPSCDSWNCRASQKFEELEQTCLWLKDKELAQNDILDTAMMSKNLTWHGLSSSKKLHEDITGEVIDLTDDPLQDKNFSSTAHSMDFSDLMTETEIDQRRKDKIARRLSFDKSSHPETNSSNIWRTLKGAQGEVDYAPETGFGKDVFPLDLKHHRKISEEGLTQASLRNLQGLPFQEEMSHLGGTPLSRALRSASSLKNSPWTIEFINRIKEKSKLRQNLLSCETSAPCYEDSGNLSRVAKRRSPSIIECFKYQGSRTPGNKSRKQSVKSSTSAKKGKYLASLPPTWTPNDKKARKMLTFTMNESGSQTKLVWSDGTQGLTKKLRYQTQ